MTAADVLFYVYASVAVAGAVGLVAAHKAIHAVMSLFATLVALSAIYLILGSEFMAAMQLFVYGGAITVLVLFVLMLTRQSDMQQVQTPRRVGVWVAGSVCLILFAALSVTVLQANLPVTSVTHHTTASVAMILFSKYVLPFEVAGLILTVALIGAIVLARQDDVTEVLDDSGAESPEAPAPGEFEGCG